MFMDIVVQDKADPHASIATIEAGAEYSATCAAVPGEVYVMKGAVCSTTVDVTDCSMTVDVTGVTRDIGGGTCFTVRSMEFDARVGAMLVTGCLTAFDITCDEAGVLLFSG